MTTEEIQDYLRTPGNEGLRYFPYQVARDLSDLAAVLLYDLQGRQENRAKPLLKDGRKWCFDAMRALAKQHRYASEPGIRAALIALERAGIVFIDKSGKYNEKKYDRKWWYHVPAGSLAKARARLIRFHPEVATSLDVPKAVLLENFRHQRHKAGAGDYLPLNPTELRIPYSAKTIGRHLEKLVAERVLERNPDDKHQYRIPAAPDWRAQKEPITAAPALLLPALEPGKIGLLVGHSATGKTSYGTFVAVQNAVAGKKVLYVSLEEPGPNIVHRMYAQEFGINYTALHRGDQAAEAELEIAFAANGARRTALESCRVIDLSSEPVLPAGLRAAINKEVQSGFAPDLVLIDQLEYITPEDLPVVDEEEADAEKLSRAYVAAKVIHECIPAGQFQTWVLHQVIGASAIDFPLQDVAGDEAVTEHFDAVMGLGRETNASDELRVFSLTNQAHFEQSFRADFPHMRFKPKDE